MEGGGSIWEARTGARTGGTLGRHAMTAYRGVAVLEEHCRRAQSAFPYRGGQQSMRAGIWSGIAAVTSIAFARNWIYLWFRCREYRILPGSLVFLTIRKCLSFLDRGRNNCLRVYTATQPGAGYIRSQLWCPSLCSASALSCHTM